MLFPHSQFQTEIETQIGRTFMSPNLLLAIVSFTACVLLTPVVRTVAIRSGWYDMPGELKIHSAPIPRLGGIALMAGILAGILFSPLISRADSAAVIILAVIWVVGLLDDLKSTSPLLRLTVDLGCGTAIWLLGWKMQWFSNPYLDLGATAVLLAFAINSMNLLDGMDGLALTVSGIASIGFIILFSGRPSGFASGLAWILAGTCGAMFVYNCPPARIFIGDSGSTLLGAALTFLALDWVRTDPATHSILVPLAFLGLPLADTIAAVIRRLRGRQSPLAGDRRHFYDLLLRRGWSVRQVLAVSAIATLVLVMASLAFTRERFEYRLPLFICLGLCGFLGFHLGSFDPECPAVEKSVPPRQFEQRLNEE
jgi:UDP-GlcNAc:undecaprenyl-phosphate/decaprenyl-phosphate GlcNAc-1-phosphate transferase